MGILIVKVCPKCLDGRPTMGAGGVRVYIGDGSPNLVGKVKVR